MPHEKFRIGIAQMVSELADVEKNLQMTVEWGQRAKAEGVDLLLFPELALNGYSISHRFADVSLKLDSPQIQALKTLSREISIATGFIEETDDAEFYNSAIYLADGEIRHIHRKVYLPNYGIFDEKRYFGSGREVWAFDTRFGRMAMLICGDCWHLPLPYLAVHDGADVLLVLAASSDEGLSPSVSCREGWERLNQTYALTMSCFVAFANRVGMEDNLHFWGGSHIVKPDGNMLAQGEFYQPDLVIGEVDMAMLRRQRITLPFRRDDSLDFTIDMGQQICESNVHQRHQLLRRFQSEPSDSQTNHQELVDLITHLMNRVDELQQTIRHSPSRRET